MEHKNILRGAFLFLLMKILCVKSEELSDPCSGLCLCEGTYMNCRSNRLSHPPNIYLTRQVESLDLSYNQMRELNSSSFPVIFAYLRDLNLSSNHIETVTVDSFANLLSIRIIDLSRNRIQQLDDRLIENNTFLHTLILDGNFLGMTPNKPLVRSQSLRKLSMRRVSIKWIDQAFFSELPLLEDVDLAFNQLHTIHPDTFSGLQQLQWLDLYDNQRTCEQQSLLEMVVNLTKRGIYVSLRDRGVTGPPNMHQNLPQHLQHFPQRTHEEDMLDQSKSLTRAVCSEEVNHLVLMINLVVMLVVLLTVLILFAIVYFQINKLRSKYEAVPNEKAWQMYM